MILDKHVLGYNTSFISHLFILTYLLVYGWGSVHVFYLHTRWSESLSKESVLSFHKVCHKMQSQNLRLGDKCLWPLSHLTVLE